MRQPVVIGSAFVAKYPNGGGNFSVPLQYLRGFLDLGCDAVWLEVLESSGDAALDRRFIETFQQRTHELGIDAAVALAFYPQGFAEPEHRIVYGRSASEIDAHAGDAVLLNLCASLRPQLRERFARTILFDLDPGFFQLWARDWGLGVGEHDVHLTIGQHLGASDCPIPLDGIEWLRTWPAVHLPSWPRVQQPGTNYTTITQWWSPESAWLGDEAFVCSKHDSFEAVIDLPSRVTVPLELAVNLHPEDWKEHARLTGKGWRVVPPEIEVSTPQQYQQYIQRSRGEFSCAKPGYVKGRTGWLSDRSICYLASGLPCVLEDTRASSHLPDTRGLRFFSDLESAAAQLRDVEGDYARACDEARSLAERLFATSVVLPAILRLAGAEAPAPDHAEGGVTDPTKI